MMICHASSLSPPRINPASLQEAVLNQDPSHASIRICQHGLVLPPLLSQRDCSLRVCVSAPHPPPPPEPSARPTLYILPRPPLARRPTRPQSHHPPTALRRTVPPSHTR